MRIRPIALHGAHRPRLAFGARPWPRYLLTLAIETSCDDTSVAILEKKTCRGSGKTVAKLQFHKKITANNTSFNGVHPLVALESHQENLAKLVGEAIEHLPPSKLGDCLDKDYLGEDDLGEEVLKELQNEHTIAKKQLPDFICVTRGPGMRSNLFTGLDTAKGLAVAWQKPLIGVHHMQAHALTPRLVAALQTWNAQSRSGRHVSPDKEASARIKVEPDFPFLSILASGGHTLLIHSASLTDHETMASTLDIAIGECLDKIARDVLPVEVLQKAGNTMYGALLERFAFPQAADVLDDEPADLTSPPTDSGLPESQSFLSSLLSPFACDEPQAPPASRGPTFALESSTAAEYRSKYEDRYDYEVPKNYEEALKRNVSRWGWGLNQPLATTAGGSKSKSMEMSFSGLMTAVQRVVQYRFDSSTSKLTKIERSPNEISNEERQDLAKHAMRAAFEHLTGRVILGLQQSPATIVVMAGGVAANSYLRYILASTLCAHGYDDVKVVFPPPSLCCDNAAMIAWAGLEMYQDGARDRLSIRAVRKWPLDQLLSPPLEKTSRFLNSKDPIPKGCSTTPYGISLPSSKRS